MTLLVNSDNTQWKDLITINNELGEMWKEAVVP